MNKQASAFGAARDPIRRRSLRLHLHLYLEEALRVTGEGRGGVVRWLWCVCSSKRGSKSSLESRVKTEKKNERERMESCPSRTILLWDCRRPRCSMRCASCVRPVWICLFPFFLCCASFPPSLPLSLPHRSMTSSRELKSSKV